MENLVELDSHFCNFSFNLYNILVCTSIEHFNGLNETASYKYKFLHILDWAKSFIIKNILKSILKNTEAS